MFWTAHFRLYNTHTCALPCYVAVLCVYFCIHRQNTCWNGDRLAHSTSIPLRTPDVPGTLCLMRLGPRPFLMFDFAKHVTCVWIVWVAASVIANVRVWVLGRLWVAWHNAKFMLIIACFPFNIIYAFSWTNGTYSQVVSSRLHGRKQKYFNKCWCLFVR